MANMTEASDVTTSPSLRLDSVPQELDYNYFSDDDLEKMIKDPHMVKLFSDSRKLKRWTKITLGVLLVTILALIVTLAVSRKQIQTNENNVKYLFGQRVTIDRALEEVHKAVNQTQFYVDLIKDLNAQTETIKSNLQTVRKEVNDHNVNLKLLTKENVKVQNDIQTMLKEVNNQKQKLEELNKEDVEVKSAIKDLTAAHEKDIKTVTKVVGTLKTTHDKDVKALHKEVKSDVDLLKSTHVKDIQKTRKDLEGSVSTLKASLTSNITDVVEHIAKVDFLFRTEIANFSSEFKNVNTTIKDLRKTQLKDFKEMEGEVNKVISEVQGEIRNVDKKVKNNVHDIQSCKAGMGKVDTKVKELKVFHTKDVQNVTAELFRFYQQDKKIRFKWPTVGSVSTNISSSHYIWGYVEIRHENIWGSICQKKFDDKDANVTCKTGGYTHGVYDNGKYNQLESKGIKAKKVWLNKLNCTGSEETLEKCPGFKWGDDSYTCFNIFYVGVKCFF